MLLNTLLRQCEGLAELLVPEIVTKGTAMIGYWLLFGAQKH